MIKNSFINSLPFKLLMALLLGCLAGVCLNIFDGSNFGFTFLNIIVTIKFIANEFINFCVPLIIIGFIAPSVTRLGKKASRMLIIALILAYTSSVGAALFATGSGFIILPHLDITPDVDGLKELPNVLFELKIPAIMPVMSALFLSVIIGVSAAWNSSKYVINVLEEFQNIILSIVEKLVIPTLPILIGTTFCTLAYEGTITKELPIFLIIIIIVMIGHYIWMALLYGLAAIYSKKNVFNVIKNYLPAYMTAVGTMSSAATLSVALECARKSKPELRDDIIDFGIPLFANIHLCGSVMTETFFVMAVSKMIYGQFPEPAKLILFCVLLGIFAVGAPGVPGGTVMASLGLITSVLNFDQTGIALMLTIFALQDSFGTACNITGDGALTLILSAYAEHHGLEQDDTNT